MKREKGIQSPSCAIALAMCSASTCEWAAASGAGGGRENSTVGTRSGAVGDRSRISLHFRLCRRPIGGGAILGRNIAHGPASGSRDGRRPPGGGGDRARRARARRERDRALPSLPRRGRPPARRPRGRPGRFDRPRRGQISSTAARLPRLVEEAAARFGRLDGLVNNASSFHATPLDGLSPRLGRTWSAPTCARRSSSRKPRRRTCAPRAAPS